MNKRTRVRIRKFLKPIISLAYEKPKLSQEQRVFVNLTKQYMLDKQSKLRISPHTMTRLVENNNILIKIYNQKITIYYNLNKIEERFELSTIDNLIKLFDLTASNELVTLESRYSTPIINKLKLLLK